MHLPLPVTTSAFVLGLMLGCTQPASTSTETTIVNPTVEETNSISQLSSGTEVIEASSTESLPPAIFTEDSVAIRGADPVAYFTEKRYVPGSADFTYEWADATWQFASADNRDVFALNPEQYAPQYGGFCAWAVAEGYTAPIDHSAWEIVDGKLCLNYEARIQRRSQRDILGNIARANENWLEVINQ